MKNFRGKIFLKLSIEKGTVSFLFFNFDSKS